MVLPLLVPRIRPDPSDKAVGSTQDQTPFCCCARPTRPAQHAGWVEEAYQNGQSLVVTLSRSPIRALGSNVSQPYNTKHCTSIGRWMSQIIDGTAEAEKWQKGPRDKRA